MQELPEERVRRCLDTPCVNINVESDIIYNLFPNVAKKFYS